MFWTLLEHGGIKVVQRLFISFYCRVSSTTVYVCKKLLFLFGKVRFGVKTHVGLKHCLFLFLLLEMCAFSTADAYTRLAAEDTCKFHTLSKHKNHLQMILMTRKVKRLKIVFKLQNIIDLLLDQT